jgi:hypothetical protein
MKKTILPLFLLLVFTGCNERNSLSAPAPSPAAASTAPTPLPDDELVIEQPKIIENTNIVHVEKEKKVETFSGGIMVDGLDIGTIRLGKEEKTTRLIFDSFKWNTNSRIPSIRAYESGYYTFTYEPEKRRIIAILDGYRGFSALHKAKVRRFGANTMIDKLTIDKYLDDSGLKFTITLKQNAKVNIFDLTAPGRIIIDMTPE